MEVRGGYLVCSATGSDLSEHARAELEQIVDDAHPVAKPASNPEMKWGVRWFCPADGLSLRETEATLICDECGRIIPARLIYELIEFNAHP